MTRVSPAETAGPHHGTTHDDSDTVHTVAPLPSTELHLAELAARLPDDLFLQLVTARRDARGRAVWRSATYPPRLIGQAAQDAATAAQWSDVYVRVTAVHSSPNSGRGGAELTGAVVALFCDLDIDAPGHAPPKDRRHPTRAEAAQLLTELGLPPTILVHTGGGFHAWWCMTEPLLTVDDESRARAQVLTRTWADGLVARANRRGFHLDNTGDLARIGRLSGTWRRKPRVDANRVYMVTRPDWATIGLPEDWGPGDRYSLDDIRAVISAAPTPAAPAGTPPRQRPTPHGRDSLGPADIIDRHTWAEILEPAGYTLTGHTNIDGRPWELWRRPGDPTSDYSLKADPDGPCIVWSDACGLPAGPGQRLTKWRVLAWLVCDGDEHELGRIIRTRANQVTV